MLSPQEINDLQGTRLSEVAPWESYDNELTGPKMSPELMAQVAEYAQKRYQDAPVSSETKEILAEQKEINNEIAKQYNWLPQAEYEDEEPRIGRVLDFAKFITILRNSGINCHYRQHPQPDKAVLWVSKDGLQQAKVAAWVQINGPMPEYELVNFDDHGVIVNTRRRGWRTVILQMILKGMITEELANKAFGPAKGPASHRFNSMLYEWRNRKIQVTEGEKINE